MEKNTIPSTQENVPLNPTPIINAPEAPSSLPQNHLSLILLSVLLSAIIFGLGGYYLGKNTNPSNLVQNAPSPSPTPSLTITATPQVADITANWETYLGTEYSFKHPADLKSDTMAGGSGVESIRFQFMGQEQTASGRTQTSLSDGYSFTITKLGSVSQKTARQWADERREKTITGEGCGPQVVSSSVKEVTVSGGSGFQYSVKNCLGSDYTNSYLSNGVNVYDITQLYVGDQEKQKTYEEITNQIFNTLRFL